MASLERFTEHPPRCAAPAHVKCLIVDDREENLLVLSTLLEQEGVDVLRASSGAEALDLLLMHDVALALLDVQMPEMDGFQLAELMRGSERTRHVPIIFVTAGVRDQSRVFKGYDAGAVDFLYKPIEPHVLRNKAEVFFQLYRQRIQLQEELRARSETLRLNEMFAAVLGHDLRSPLGAMMVAGHLIQQRAADDLTREAASRILSSGTRMTRMIQALLDLARARLAGGIPVQLTPGDLGAAIRRVVDEHALAAAGRRIEFDARGALEGTWDAERLAQMASNLIGNAVQHGRADAPVEVVLDGTVVDAVVLTVTNAGTIAPHALSQLFDPFRQGARQSRVEGLGLGLYIAQQIAHAHCGTIAVESTQQTVFRVTIPRVPPASAAERAR